MESDTRLEEGYRRTNGFDDECSFSPPKHCRGQGTGLVNGGAHSLKPVDNTGMRTPHTNGVRVKSALRSSRDGLYPPDIVDLEPHANLPDLFILHPGNGLVEDVVVGHSMS